MSSENGYCPYINTYNILIFFIFNDKFITPENPLLVVYNSLNRYQALLGSFSSCQN